MKKEEKAVRQLFQRILHKTTSAQKRKNKQYNN